MRTLLFGASALGGALAVLALPRASDDPAMAIDRRAARSAQTIVAEYESIKLPQFFDLDELTAFEAKCRKKALLAWELYTGHPQHPRVARMLEARWSYLNNTFFEHAAVIAEAEDVLAQATGPNAASVRRAALWAAAHAGYHLERIPVTDKIDLVERALAAAPADHEAAAFLWTEIARNCLARPAAQRTLLERAVREAESPAGAATARDHLAILARVGEPLALSFRDARTGRDVSLAQFQGRKVLVQCCDLANHRYYERTENPAFALMRELNGCAHPPALITITSANAESEPLVRHALDELGIAWPCWIERSETPLGGWAARVGVQQSWFFLLLDEQGRLEAATPNLFVLQPELGKRTP